MAYNDCYKRATIIMERVVRLETLKDTSIPEVFKERTWTKLLNPSGNVYKEIIREFFSNAIVDGDHINCQVRHKEFVITKDSIQKFLEICPPSQPITVHYDDQLNSLEPMVERGSLKKKLMKTIPFNAWRARERFFAEFFGFLFDNTSACYLVFAFFFPTLLAFILLLCFNEYDLEQLFCLSARIYSILHLVQVRVKSTEP